MPALACGDGLALVDVTGAKGRGEENLIDLEEPAIIYLDIAY